jgi:hypothetical protein
VRHRPGTEGPTRVVVVRERGRAHGLTAQEVAAQATGHAPRPVVAPAPRRLVQTAAVARHVVHQPRRQYSMRVRRAGERG